MDLDVQDKEDRDQELLEQAFTYITCFQYPPECTENRKRVIRKKSKKFVQKDGVFYYKQTVKGKVQCTILVCS